MSLDGRGCGSNALGAIDGATCLFLDLKGARRGVSLAGYARRLVCRNCKSRELAFALGAHRPGDGIGFGGTYRPISFRDGLAVRAPRD